MALVGKCCFIFPLKTAVVIIGFIFMAVSFSGILVSVSSLLHYFKLPRDPLLVRLLHVCFFLEVQGIVFHTILFIFSTLLTFGAIARIQPLLIAWLGWSPFLILGVIVQMILVIAQQPNLAMPVFAFCLMVLIFIIYSAFVVVAYSSDLYKDDTIQLRIFNLQEGELPRIVRVPRQFFMRFKRPRDPNATTTMPTTSSARPLQEYNSTRSSDQNPPEIASRSGMRQKLINAYGRFKNAKRMVNKQRNPPTDTTHF